MTSVQTKPADYAGQIPPLRVCHLTKYYPPAAGGIETHVRTIAQAQAMLGIDVQVLCVNHRDQLNQDMIWRRFARTRTLEELDGSVRVIRLGRMASIARLDLCPSLVRRLLKVQNTNCDVVHLHVPNPTMLLALALVGVKVPLVITYHSDVVRQKLLRLMQRPFERLIFRKARGIFCTSPVYAAGSSVLAEFPGKVGELPFGINPAPYLNPSPSALAYASKLRADHGNPLWLAIGRLVYYKGLHVALQSLQQVQGRLLVIGQGPLERSLRKLSLELGVSDRVIWQAKVNEDELAGAYRAATALWFPSNARSEGFGLVQLEAMASGCPIINTAIAHSGVPWVSQNEVTGLTVPVEDPGAFAAAANRLLAEPELRARLGLQAQQRATAEFHYLHMGRRSLEAYTQAIELNSGMVPRDCLPANASLLPKYEIGEDIRGVNV